MLERSQEFARQIAVGHQYDTNHPSPPGLPCAVGPPGPLGVSVGESDRAADAAQPVCQHFGQGDGAVAAAGAADGDGEIALALEGIERQQRFQERDEAAEESGKMPIAPDVERDFAVAAGLDLQLPLVPESTRPAPSAPKRAQRR